MTELRRRIRRRLCRHQSATQYVDDGTFVYVCDSCGSEIDVDLQVSHASADRLQPTDAHIDLVVPKASITHALIAIERARAQGIYDAEQIRSLGPLVNGLRDSEEGAKTDG